MSRIPSSRLQTLLSVIRRRSGRQALMRANRRNYLKPSMEQLESRQLLAIDLPAEIFVGRTLSAYSTNDVLNNELKLTYTVYNQREIPIDEVRLADTLLPGISFVSGSQSPVQNGQELTWSIGTIPAYGRASVEITVSLASGSLLQLDEGAQVFGTVDAGIATDSAPAAILRNSPLNAAELAATVDANSIDPVIQEKAAELDYDPARMFAYLRDEVGYESYVGSLRGARGTLWSEAGNSLDETSLGVALFRASGIPARYAHGTLSDALSKELIASMFAAPIQVVGYLPANSQLADPINNAALLSETQNHYWLQFDTGSGFLDADTSGLVGSGIGIAFATASETFTTIDDSIRHRVRISLDAELFSQSANAFGPGTGLQTTTVLDRTWSTVELVGRPIAVSQYVNQVNQGGLAFTSRSITYSPFFRLSDTNNPTGESDEIFTGTPFQELLTNFPLASTMLTGLNLNMGVISPDGTVENENRMLVDRIGFAARQGGIQTTFSVDANGLPARAVSDAVVLSVLPGKSDPRESVQLEALTLSQQDELNQLTGVPFASLPHDYANLVQSFVINQLTVLGVRNNRSSDEVTDVAAKLSLVSAYADSPRLVLLSSQTVPAVGNQPDTLRFEIDLRRDRVRAYASPEQSTQAEAAFQTIRGRTEAVIEKEIIADQRLANPSQNSVNATNVFLEANRQGIPIVALTTEDLQRLSEVIEASETALARISQALNEDRMVVVPSRPVTINAMPTTSWFEMNIQTGELIAVTESGTHGDAAEYASLFLMASLGFVAGMGANAQFAKNPGLKEAIQATGLALSNEFWYLSYLVKVTNGGVKAFQAGYQVGSGLGSLMTGVDPSAEAIFINTESNEILSRSNQIGMIASPSTGSLRMIPQTTSVSATQNSAVDIPFLVSSDQIEEYTIDALAPEGWMVKVTGQSLSIRPAAGIQSGSGTVRLTIRSLSDSTRVMSELITVEVLPTAPGINFDIALDPIFTVPYRGAELPTAFRATTQNLSPSSQEVTFSYSNVTPGWEIIASRDGYAIPAGESSVHGIYLRPISGTIPSPGSSVSFTVTADPSGTLIAPISRTVTFAIGNVESIQFTAEPVELTAIPGSSVDGSIQLTNLGNVPTTVSLNYSPLPSDFGITSIPQSVTLAVGENIIIPYSVTPSSNVPLNSYEYIRFQTTGGTMFTDRVSTARVRVVVPGAQSIATAAISANQLGETELAEQLSNLIAAISDFVQAPTDSIAQSHTLSSLDAIIRHFQADPTLTQYVGLMSQVSDDLAAATTSNEIRDALLILESVMIGYAQQLQEEVEHGFTFSLASNVVTALPGVPARFPLLLENKGTQATTFDLSVGGFFSSDITATFSQSTVTLQPGERLDGGPSGVTLELLFAENRVFPTGFVVIATPQEALSLTQRTSASVAVRAEFIQVATVTPSPAFTEPGGLVEISARILNVVNREQVVLVSYRITDSNGSTVFTSPAQAVTLNVRSSLTEVVLPTFDTTSLARADYTITVLVTDSSGASLPGGEGQATLLVGTPVSATLTVSPDSLLSVNNIVTNTLRLDARRVMPSPVTLLGQVQTLPTATTILVNGNIAYVAGTNGIDIVDVVNPLAPQILGTFGQGQIVQGGFTVVRALSGDRIIVATRGTLNSTNLTLLTYSTANPTAPVLLGQTTIAERFITDLFIVGDRAIATTNGIVFIAGNVVSQFGDVLSLDLANPAAVTVTDKLFGSATDDFNQNGGELVDANTLYVASTTSTGGLSNTQLGNGLVRVLDYSNPANLSQIRDVTIPGTVQVLDIAVEGNRALVVGSTGGWKSPFLGAADAQLTGRMTLTLLDITDHRNPIVLGTTLITESLNRPIDTADGGAKLAALALGDGRFAISRGYVNGGPVLLLADISDDEIVVASVAVPSMVNEMAFVNDTLYTTSQSGLLNYDVGAIESTTTRVAVQVPNSNTFGNVNQVRANSFNIPPDQIIPGAGFNSLIWNRPFAFGTTTSTLTWQTDISGLAPGESWDVTTGTDVSFVYAGSPGAFALPATSVVGQNAVALSPASQTVAPGSPATYTVTLSNPTNRFLSFTLSTSGVPDSWVGIPRNVIVNANSTSTVALSITAPATAPNGSMDFVVFASANGAVQGTAQGTLVLDGVPSPPDSASHGVVASLTPSTATAGQGTDATYVVRLTNTGSETETFALTSILPAGVTAAFESAMVTIPPGTSNYREITVVLTPDVGTATGLYPFDVIATSTNSGATGTTTGELEVLSNGVRVELNASTGNPGDTFQITVTNTGTVTDTYALKTAGPAGVSATLSASQLTLAPNQSQVVTVTTADVDFVVPGSFNLTVFARSQSVPVIVDSDSVELLIPATKGLASRFDPASKELTTPGSTSFLLFVDNIGNTEDSYTATITEMDGPILASLVGLNGQPTPSIPIFRLPGLATGTVVVNAALTNAGQGTFRVQIRSLTDGSIVSESTATLTAVAAAVSLSALSADKVEGDSGTTTFTFDVTRAGNVFGTTTVDFAVLGSGSEPANSSDFAGALFPNGQVTFAPNETIKTILINVSGDTIIETDEGFTVTLSNASGGATINVASVVGNIRNDDVNNPPVAVADVAISIEAGGLNNGTAGTNPTGNVLDNDSDVDPIDTKSVVGVAAGTPSSASSHVGVNVYGSYGIININSSGDFAYTLDNTHTSVQALRSNADSLVDLFTYTMRDLAGLLSTALVTITITGTNDTATITGAATGDVTEDAVLTQAVGALLATDPDAGQASFQLPSDLNGIYGAFSLNASTGAWTYTLDNSRPATNALIAGQIVTDILTVQSFDGSASRSITITITGADENSDNPTVHVLNATACSSLTMSGNASITIPGSVQVNSSCRENAINASGNARITASQVRVLGGVRMTGNAQISPAPLTESPPRLDPYAAIGAPDGVAAKDQIVVNGNTKITVSPGSYTKISASGNSSLTLLPGIYIIDGGGLSISGNASIIGNGVMIYNAGSNFPYPGGSFGSISVSGNGQFDLTPPSSGAYSGMTFFQARENTQRVIVTGNASKMSGLLYAPGAQLDINGNGQLQMSLIVDRLNMSGNASTSMTTVWGYFNDSIHAVLDTLTWTSFGRATSRIDSVGTTREEFGTLAIPDLPLVRPRTVLTESFIDPTQDSSDTDQFFAELSDRELLPESSGVSLWNRLFDSRGR